MSELKPKPTTKDRIYVWGLAIVGANLAGWMANAIRLLVANPSSLTLWSYLAADIIAFVGVIWFIRSYRRGRRLARAREWEELGPEEEEEEEEEEGEPTRQPTRRPTKTAAGILKTKRYRG